MASIDATREPVLVGELMMPLLRNLADANPDTVPDWVREKLAAPSMPLSE